MPGLPEDWEVAGIWQDHDYYKSEDLGDREFTDSELAYADAIICAWHDPGDDSHTEYITLHGADDWETVADLIGDIDEDVYFG